MATQSGTPTLEPTGSGIIAPSNTIGLPPQLTSPLFGVTPKPTVPTPIFMLVGTARPKSRNGGSGPPTRRMVPTPRSRPLQRVVSKQCGRHQASPPTSTRRHWISVAGAYQSHSRSRLSSQARYWSVFVVMPTATSPPDTNPHIRCTRILHRYMGSCRESHLAFWVWGALFWDGQSVPLLWVILIILIRGGVGRGAKALYYIIGDPSTSLSFL